MATPKADTIAEAIEMFFSEHSDSQIGELLHHAGYGVERGHPTVEEFIETAKQCESYRGHSPTKGA